MTLPQCPPKYGKILGVDEDEAAVHLAGASDHSVAEELQAIHPEIRTMVGHQHSAFRERSRVEEEVDALPGCQFSKRPLPFDLILAAAELCNPFSLFQLRGL